MTDAGPVDKSPGGNGPGIFLTFRPGFGRLTPSSCPNLPAIPGGPPGGASPVLVQLVHFQWQVLRAVLRAEAAGQPAVGRDLRLVPTRATKDGSFLDELIDEGLLAKDGKPEPEGDRRGEPVPFRTKYRLTEKGRQAAEYGEYDRPFTPGEAPVVGPAAEILQDRTARRFPGAKVGRS
jgi:hypothetical protein